MKIGILGGSFNPPHQMHKKIALTLLEKKYVDEVIFVPTGKEYPKKGLIPFSNRYQMAQEMIKNMSHVMVSDYESKQQLIYTYQTLDYFKKIYPHDTIYFILGSDNLKELDTWKNYPYILKNYPLLVINRHDNIDNILLKYQEFKPKIEAVKIEENFLSSTYIRNQLKQNKSLKNDFLDEKVYFYIKKHRLYEHI